MERRRRVRDEAPTHNEFPKKVSEGGWKAEVENDRWN
jgi:hypothetical protein